MKYLKLILPILILFAGVQFLKDYFVGNNSKLTEAQTLVDQGKTVEAVLNPEYKQMTIGGAEVDSYTIMYTYDVNGKKYEESESVNKLPEITNLENKVNITYLPSDPSVCSINPQDKLSKAKEDSDSKISLYIGLAALVIGGLTLFGRVKELKEPTA